jgi:methionyl-tRNA formyltransferase
MRIVYMGNGSRGVACLRALLAKNEQVVAAVVHPGPRDQVEPGSVKELALRHAIPVSQPDRVNGTEFRDTLRTWKPDLVVMVGYNQILRKDILEIPPRGCLNLHGGKLPDYRGTAPLNWAIINGETRIGLSILFADEGIDTGDIVAETQFTIARSDTIREVVQRSLELFPDMLLGVLASLRSGAIRRMKQDPAAGAYYTRRYPRDGMIRWEFMSAVRVHNLVRALTRPYPGAFTFLDGKRLFVWKASLLEHSIQGIAGRVALRRGDGVVVIASDRGLLLEEVQIEGEEPRSASSLFRSMGVDLR